MTTSNFLLPHATKHRFDRSERILGRLTSVLAPDAILPVQSALQSDSRETEERSLSTSQMVVERLRAERLARGWTQKELAARSGIERANIARLEAGKHSPRLDTLEALAGALGLPMAELFETARAAAELTELNLRQVKEGVVRLKKDLRRMRELGIIDEAGNRINRKLPAEMLEGTSEAV